MSHFEELKMLSVKNEKGKLLLNIDLSLDH